MIDKLANLWDTKRWLFWLLLPITIVAAGVKFYLDYLESKSERDMEEAVEESANLEAKKKEANKQANEVKAEADKIEERIEERKEENVDIDWHLKG